jgi:hypothetical protein
MAFLLHLTPRMKLEKTVFLMEHNRAVGPDGFPTEFYQSFSDVIKSVLLALFGDLHTNNYSCSV